MRARKTRLPVCARLFVAVLAILTAVPLWAAPKKKEKTAPVPGATPSPVAAPAPDPAAKVRLRIWKAEFASKRVVHLVVRPAGGHGAATDLGEFPAGSRFGNYESAPGGECTVEVRAPGDDGAVLATSAVSLSGAASTLVLRENDDGAIAFELIDDKPTGDEASAELFVRNFVPALRSLQLDSGADLHVRLVTPGSFLHLRGLVHGRLEMKITAEDGAGSMTYWTNEIDLHQVRRATLLIVADPHGRIRPRFVVDGGGSPEAAGSAPASAPGGDIK